MARFFVSSRKAENNQLIFPGYSFSTVLVVGRPGLVAVSCQTPPQPGHHSHATLPPRSKFLQQLPVYLRLASSRPWTQSLGEGQKIIRDDGGKVAGEERSACIQPVSPEWRGAATTDRPGCRAGLIDSLTGGPASPTPGSRHTSTARLSPARPAQLAAETENNAAPILRNLAYTGFYISPQSSHHSEQG